MASLSAYYPLPVVAGTTAGTYAEGNDSRIEGALPAATAGSGSVLASGSTTSRTLSQRFGEIFHVDDYGAVGDWNGTTGTDDTVAIQAAINAAVAAGGGVIRFGAGKKYRLVSMTGISNFTVGITNLPSFAGHLFVGSGNYVSGFGSTTMNLLFDGQGAALHSDFYEPSKGSTIHFVCQFQKIVIRDLTFSKSQYTIPNQAQSSQTTAINIFAIDANRSELFRVENCTFINQFSGIVSQVRDLAPNIFQSDCEGKLENFECVGCQFYYPYGSGRAAASWPEGKSGALAVMLCTHIRSAVFDRCYMDGMVGEQIPAGYEEAMHGFLFPMPIKCKITNCYFKNCEVEVIKASDIETAQCLPIEGGFTQVPVWDGQAETKAASTISRAITGNGINLTKGSRLVVGRVYCLFNQDTFASNRGGFYVLNPKVGGGNYTFDTGEELSLTRVSSEPYQAIREISVGASFGSSVVLIDVTLLEECELIVSNTTFEGNPLKNSSGQLISPAAWDRPSILCDYRLIANGNSFVGGGTNIYSQASCGDFLPTIITDNSFYKYTPFNTQSDGSSISFRKSNVLIANNVFTIENYLASSYILFLGGHEIRVLGNYCLVKNPDPSNLFPWFINYEGPWRILSEDNYLKDLASYGNAGDAGQVASYYGSIRGTTVRSGSQPIRLAKTFKSQDKSTWTVGVTNDGELEVIK